MSMDLTKLKAVRLGEGRDFSTFYCSSEKVNKFLRNLAEDLEKKSFCRTYLLYYDQEIVGYFSLASGSLPVKKLSLRREIGEGHPYEYFPSILICWFGTAEKHEHKGIGKQMLKMIYKIAERIRERVGCRYIIVNSLPDAISWWEINDYVPLRDEEGQPIKWHYLDILKIKTPN